MSLEVVPYTVVEETDGISEQFLLPRGRRPIFVFLDTFVRLSVEALFLSCWHVACDEENNKKINVIVYCVMSLLRQTPSYIESLPG